jgi:hypothetical protein
MMLRKEKHANPLLGNGSRTTPVVGQQIPNKLLYAAVAE